MPTGVTSSSSSEETVEVEEGSSEEYAPEATAKSAARPKAASVEPRRSDPVVEEERRGRSVEPRGERRGRSATRRARVARGGAKRPRSPEAPPKGKGKGDKADHRVACRFCHQLVGNNIAAMSQHQYWNWTFLRWQRYRAGTSWEESAAAATRQKQRRDDRARTQLGMPLETYEAPKAALAEATPRKGRSAEKAKGSKHNKDPKGKKDKRAKPRVVSPSPEVRKERGHKRPPSSSDSEGHGPPKHHRGPRTLVIRLPDYGK